MSNSTLNHYQIEFNQEFPSCIQGLGLCTCTAKGTGSILGQGTKIQQAAWCGQRQSKTHKSLT